MAERRDSLVMNGSQQGAETPPKKSQQTESQQSENRATALEFVINTYPDLQPFLEMAVLLLEGVYEHKRMLDVVTSAPTDSSEK